MGHAHSRHQHDAQRELADQEASSSSSTALHRTSDSNNSHSPDLSNGDAAASTNSRKRRRDSASSAPGMTALPSEHQPLSQRRRTRASPTSNSQASLSIPAVLLDTEPQRSSTGADHADMDVDVAGSSRAAAPSSEDHPQTAEAATTTASQSPSAQPDPQQGYAAVQSRADTPSAVEAGATPPPHLDALRDERERARRQILEALASAPGSGPAIATPLSSYGDGDQAAATSPGSAVPPSGASTPAPSSALASATIAALLGAIATAPPTNTAGRNATASDSATAPSTSASQNPSQPSPQPQRPQPAPPQAFRVPLQPEMISGTSMVVQGALVARTLANRPPSSDPSSPARSSHDGGHQPTTNEASTTPPPSVPSSGAATGTDSVLGVPGAPLEGDSLRGAVTLEEQAVMLSRILGIAAAATAASLLNTSEAQHVDPSLLQTSLRTPFERMNQTPNNRNERWLADWQRAGTSNRTSSANTGTDSTAAHATSLPPSHSLGNGLRGRLAALSRRVQSASSSSGLASAEHGRNTVDRTAGSADASGSAAATGAQVPSNGAAGTAAAEGDTAEERAARREEIIAHLLSAAEREAASQRLTRVRSAAEPSTSTAEDASDRARSSSFSAFRPPVSSTQQDTPRSSLSRLVRSTIGTFLHPSRLLPNRNTQPSGSHQEEGWTSGSTGRTGSNFATSPSSDFSLGPNDVSGTLRQVRNGILPDGVPGSFGSFLNHLVNDLMAAVQLMRPSTEEPLPSQARSQTAQTTNYFEHANQSQATSGAEVLDGESAASHPQAQSAQAAAFRDDTRSDSQASPSEEDVETQARRQRDFQNGNLSFFRLFRFDPVAPSQLVPCIVVGVRSLNVTERFGEEMAGERAAGPGREFNGSRQQTSRPTTLGSSRPPSPRPRQRAQSEGAPAASGLSEGAPATADGEELPASRFMLFVSGGRYPPNHPLLTSNPSTAGRDLMILMDLLSTMQAMQHKPATVTQREIDASDLPKIKGWQVAAEVGEGRITENMAERCLVCLEDWRDDDDCRVLACRHAFHTTCVDRWMTSSSNTCPMCRRQGVSKDGRQAGAETADSRRAAQG